MPSGDVNLPTSSYPHSKERQAGANIKAKASEAMMIFRDGFITYIISSITPGITRRPKT
jgi:hypothetical protein